MQLGVFFQVTHSYFWLSSDTLRRAAKLAQRAPLASLHRSTRRCPSLSVQRLHGTSRAPPGDEVAAGVDVLIATGTEQAGVAAGCPASCCCCGCIHTPRAKRVLEAPSGAERSSPYPPACSPAPKCTQTCKEGECTACNKGASCSPEGG